MFSAFLVIALTLGQIPSVFAQFSDVKQSSEFSTAINALKEAGVLEGYSDGTFKEGNEINRAELLKIVLEAQYDSGDIVGSNCFSDVTNQWYAKYVCFAKEKGVVSGYEDGTFRPERNINFAELSKILSLAYNIEPETDASVWFRGYIEALESSNAIPTTINNFDKKVSRGEMAEMMWRIDADVTTKPSTTYFNIKHPDSSFNPKRTTVQLPKNCSELETILTEFSHNYPMPMPFMRGDMAMPMATMSPEAAVSNAVGATAEKSFSTTNVQVQGIDESDTVKTDGKYIYTLRNNAVQITEVDSAGGLKIITEKKLQANEKDMFYASEMYVDNGFIVIIGSRSEYMNYPTPAAATPEISSKMIAPIYWQPSIQKIEVRLYSLQNSSLNLERTVDVTGSTISTRVMDNTLYLVSSYGQNYWYYPAMQETKILPTFSDSAANITDKELTPCEKITILPNPQQPTLLSTSRIPLAKSGDIATDTIVASGETVYMSTDNMYITSTNWSYGWAKGPNQQSTSIYRFAINNDGVEYAAQGTVPGRILNQFSMDEHENSFRIATTVDQDWQNNTVSKNNLYVLNLNLETVGSVTNIAPDETIYSVRFMGDRTYMVTFKKVDPFFVIDTSDPRNPSILGQLKIPGYSDYLHPYDENHVIGFGKDAVADKDFAWYQGMKIALFDVSDVANPTLKDSISIGDRGTNSELLYNHKALLFEKDRNLLAFPIEIYTLTEEQKRSADANSAWGTSSFQGAMVYTISPKGFTERGRITHYTEEDKVKLGSYFYGKSIERILRIDNSLFTIGQDGIQSHDEESLQKQDAVEFTAEEQYNYPIMY